MAVSMPILVTLLVRGDNFIGVWMGPQYSRTSGIVLSILATALLFSLPNAPASSIALGIGKHKTIAKWAIGEAVANLSLSVVLARIFGIYGVAVGTLVPSLVVNLCFWPRYVTNLVKINYRQVLVTVWGPLLLSVVPFAAASYLVDVFFPARNMAMFILQTVALLPIFAMSIGWILRNDIRRTILPRIGSLFHIEAR
jgi:O-antigen/teichoic acid export membrane protein